MRTLMFSKALEWFKAHHNPYYHHLTNVCCFVLMGKLYFKMRVSWTEIILGIVAAVITEALIEKFLLK
jgi:hypothetical protein